MARDYQKELIDDLDFGRMHGYKFTLVDANPEKGFNYPYLIYIPNNPKNTMIMDCLNDYEENMPAGQIENLESVEEVCSLFQGDERISHTSLDSKGKTEESKEETLKRLYYRMEKAINALSNSIARTPDAPTLIPIIPGYGNEGFNNVTSQLDKDVIGEIAPQIKSMVEDAKTIIKQRTGTKLNGRIIPFGHSKSSTFASNFATYYPEMCEAAILGGGEFSILPIDEIALQIIKEDQISDDEKFEIIEGKVTKKITQKDLERIIEEYSATKRNYQDEITINSNGTYNLPMNFPIGIADIEHYRDLSNFPNGKEGYRQALSKMPKMIFLGEQEEIIEGHYAYIDGITLEGMKVKAGDDIEVLQEKLNRRPITELEPAGMHNRILEYIAANNSLLGRSVNERLRNFMQLSSILNIPIQSKIYKDVGHTDIFKSKPLKEDVDEYYQGLIIGDVPKLNDNGRAIRINPVHQLIRRYLAVEQAQKTKREKIIQGISKEQIMTKIEQYIASKGISPNNNIDRIFDDITPKELDVIFEELEMGQKVGIDDCTEDYKTKKSSVKQATRTTKEELQPKTKETNNEIIK